MKPFKLTAKQKTRRDQDLRRKDQIVERSSRAMNAVLRGAVEEVYAHFVKTGRYKDPDLSLMDDVTETFYRNVVGAAVDSCDAHVPKKKRLAKVPDVDLPEGPRALERVLNNRAYWRKIMRRARALTGRAKKAYLDKLRKQFKRVLPLFEVGDMSPREVKTKIAEAWKAPAARTETIFRTESTNYFASAQVEYFKESPYLLGFLFDSVRDTSRTPICQSRHGLIYRPGSKLLETNTPACHYNCRSHLIPLVNDPENRRMFDEPNRDPSKRKVVPLPPGWRS